MTAVAARLERLRRRPPARLVGAILIVAAVAGGVYARSAGVELGTGFAPFTMLERRVAVDGPWRPLLPVGLAVVAAIALLHAGPRVGQHLFPLAAFAVALVARPGWRQSATAKAARGNRWCLTRGLASSKRDRRETAEGSNGRQGRRPGHGAEHGERRETRPELDAASA